MVEPPPPQPLVSAIVIANSNTGTAKASLATEALCPKRGSAPLRDSIQSSAGSIKRTQRLSNGLRGLRSGIEGNDGINNAFAVVLTLIATVAGAVCVTVTGEAGPVHVALSGAPVQFAVTLSWSEGEPPTRESWREYMAVCPAFTVAEVELPDAAPKEKSSGAFMVSVSGVEVLGAKLASPPYVAVMECDPAASEEVASVATPEELSVLVPGVVEPSLNVTVPEGVPTAPIAFDTVAVNVTDWPVVAGLGAAAIAVVVDSRFTVSVSAADVLPVKFVSPEYFAVIEWVPIASDDVLSVACPFAPSAPVPICAAPSKNTTVPVGVPVVELKTVAVSVTDCAKGAGFGEDASAVELAV